MRESSAAGCLLLAVLTVLWGGNWPAMKLALREIDPWTFRTICLLVGGGGLLALVQAGGQSLRVPRSERWPLAMVAFFNITVWHLCSAYGLTLIQAGRAVIIGYTMPLWTVVAARILVGEPMTPRRVTALGLGLAGLAVLVAPDLGALQRAPGGVLLMLVAGLSWAIGTVLTKARRWAMPTAALTGWQVLLGGTPIAVGALLRLAAGGAASGTALEAVSPAALMGIAYATVVGVIFCHWAWFRIVGLLPASVAAIGTLGVPIVGLFSSGLVLGEPVGAAELLALVLVVTGLGIMVGGLTASSREALPPARPVSTLGRESR